MDPGFTLTPGRCLIDGQWVEGEQTFEMLDPADGSLAGHAPLLGGEAAQAAIAAAQRALGSWAAAGAAYRARLLVGFNALILENEAALAAILTREQGKPLSQALGEIRYAASFISWFAEEARRVYGKVVPTPDRSKRILVLKQPIGVVAAITPWNFPAAMVTRKIGPALAAGCTVVLKPAEQTQGSEAGLTWIEGCGLG